MDHGGKWRHENEWPIARTKYTPYYLHADGTLGPEKSGEATPSTTYTYDPADPVPTIGGTSYFYKILPGLTPLTAKEASRATGCSSSSLMVLMISGSGWTSMGARRRCLSLRGTTSSSSRRRRSPRRSSSPVRSLQRLGVLDGGQHGLYAGSSMCTRPTRTTRAGTR